MSQIVKLSLEEEMKKNPEMKRSDIEKLREWCEKEPHLPKITDSSLAMFLHSNYYHMEPTKIAIDHYYTMRTHIRELFAGRDPKDHKHFGDATVIPLKQCTKEGYNIIFAKNLSLDPSKFDIGEYMKLMFMVADLWLYRTGTNNGYLLICDFGDITLGHAARYNPIVAKAMLFYAQEAMPIRLKGLHLLNVNAGMEAILKMVKPFFKKQLLDMMHMHTSTKTLEQFLPIEALPNEMGGKAGPLMELHEVELKELEVYRNWFLEEELSSRVDESKRLGKAKSASDYFGVDGNFKKLDVD